LDNLSHFFDFFFSFLYFPSIIIGVGLPLWYFREKIQHEIRLWNANESTKFFLLGYGFVLFEETFAAFFNHLSEGFHFILFLERIGQFWLFNIFAFTGFYCGWNFLLTRFRFSVTEVFVISGIWGLVLERVFGAFFSNPVYFFSMTPLVMTVYGLIITPSFFAMEEEERKEISLWKRYVFPFLAFPLFSLVPVFFLQTLRIHYSWLFPPLEFIPM